MKALRAQRNHSLREAADHTGVSHTTISRIEKGEAARNFRSTLAKIAAGYGVTTAYLLHGDHPPVETREAQFRRLAAEDATVPKATVNTFARLMHKALEAGLDARVVDRAVDLAIELRRTMKGE